MKTKILIGSIGVVTILILVSFTNVVGVQSTKSGSVNNSPLFSIRTKKAINEESPRILTFNYFGKGNELKLFIPSRNNDRMLLRKAIDRLQGMDDEIYTKFLKNALHRLTTQDKYNDVNVPRLIFTLNQIKKNPEVFERYLTSNNDDLTVGDYPSVYAWFPGCILLEIITLILLIIYSIIGPTFLPTCHYCPHLY